MDLLEEVKKECLRRKMSHNTIQAYCNYVRFFLGFCSKDMKNITKSDIKGYLDYLTDKDLSGSTLNIALSALKFLIKEVLHKNWQIRLKYSKTPKKLPVVLTQKETRKLLDCIKNEKHYLLVSLMYSAGLRLSEVINLKVEDIEFEKNYGWVRGGKGNKDRMFIVARSIKNELLGFVKNREHSSYVFSGPGGKLGRSTVYKLVKRYSRIAGIKKNIHPHTLRHSFATHLVEYGYTLENVQSLLGHESIETTKGYIHTAMPKINIRSPLDIIMDSG